MDTKKNMKQKDALKVDVILDSIFYWYTQKDETPINMFVTFALVCRQWRYIHDNSSVWRRYTTPMTCHLNNSDLRCSFFFEHNKKLIICALKSSIDSLQHELDENVTSISLHAHGMDIGNYEILNWLNRFELSNSFNRLYLTIKIGILQRNLSKLESKKIVF